MSLTLYYGAFFINKMIVIRIGGGINLSHDDTLYSLWGLSLLTTKKSLKVYKFRSFQS